MARCFFVFQGFFGVGVKVGASVVSVSDSVVAVAVGVCCLFVFCRL